VQIVENWTKVRGSVVSISPTPKQAGQLTVTLQVESVAPVDSFPNLLEKAAGEAIAVILPADHALAASLKAGDQVEAQVRRGQSRNFFHPDRLKVKR
jgi:hypothetical protein